MDTINSIAKTAANAVWGPNTTDGKEPISGQQGDVSAGEPFDKGNVEEPHSTTSATPNTTSAATGGAATSSDPTTTSSTTTGPSTTSTTGHSTTAATEGSKAAEFAGNTGTAAESSKVPDNERTELKSKDTPSDTTSGQNDTRDPTNPQTNPKNNPTDVDDTEEGVNKGQKLDGPGPKPLNEVAKEHGGDAGASEKTATSASEGKTENAAESDDPNDPHAPSKGEGTGEKYIKSSGMHADGGDFDAANAGAGREADRLMEEKGIHTSKDAPKGDAASDDKTPASPGSEEKKKTSLAQKIKNKLHHNKE
ncbi:hypothetical protein KJ359_011143 [Pestalotiopsis sp. 9143b]|nr:hypothetical protein KJ359_011143 [Pestalotiopsis sp. 9143b]